MALDGKFKLGIAAAVIIGIIIIVGVVANEMSRSHHTSNQDTKSEGHQGIIPETTTTTTKTTTPSPPPPETVPTSETNIILQETTTNTDLINNTDETEDDPIVPINKCESLACVSQAMILMMDRTQNACENFYQYACGGVMNESSMEARRPGTMARMMIKKELERQNSNDIRTGAGKMKALYDGCLNSGNQDVRKDWAKSMRDMFGDYKFRADTSFTFDLSEALGHMMNKGFMPFFTMELDVDPANKEVFILSQHPTVPGSRFTDDLAGKVCLKRHHEYLLSLGNSSYNVTEEYEKFRKCVGSGAGLEARLDKMKDAVGWLQLMNHLTDVEAEKLLTQTISNTKEFLMELSETQPYVPDLISNLANRNYHSIDYVTDLPDTPINWVTVVKKFFNVNASFINSYRISTYQTKSLNEMTDVLQYYNEGSQQEMNNILLLLWAERIYTDFVEPVGTSVGNPEYCLNAAIALMEDTASYLYLQAVVPDISARNAQIDTIAENIKREALRVMENSAGKEDLQDKLRDMMDNVVKLDKVNEEISTSSMDQVSLNGDFLHNSLVLLAHRSTLTKKLYDEGTRDNYRVFARPYDPSGFYSYQLNRIMIPYAAQEPFHALNQLPQYLQYATLGQLISRLLWHGYDTSGRAFTVSGPGDLRDMGPLHRNLKHNYFGPRNYTDHKGLTANYKMTELTLNEIWADTMGTDLAWHAYVNRNRTSKPARRRRRAIQEPLSSQEPGLPSLDMSPQQLYYLQWAQQYCSGTSDLRMLEVMESRQPPGIERVNYVTRMSEEFSNAFHCLLKQKSSFTDVTTTGPLQNIN